MKVNSQLIRAQLENRGSDYSQGIRGLLWLNNTAGTIKYDDGSNIRTVVDLSLTQAITNKTIVVASNTITTAASGNLTSTELNAALAELQTDIDSRALGTTVTGHINDTSAHGVTGDVVGTSDAQVLTNKDIDGGVAANTRRITLPGNTKTNLDALTRKAGTVVYATDTKKAYLDNGDSLIEVGAGASGAINYIPSESRDAETSTGDWYTFDESPLSTGGEVGTPSFVSISTTTSELRGEQSFTFSKAVGDASGEGFGILLDPIERADQGKVLEVSFEFRGDDNYPDGDLKAYVIDTGTLEIIQLTPHEIPAIKFGANLTMKWVGHFQAPVGSTSLIFVLYIETDNASADSWELTLDSFSVSPVSRTYGTVITDWEDYDGLSSSVWTGATWVAKKKRMGDVVKIAFEGTLEADDTGALTINTGFSIDTDKLPTGTDGRSAYLGWWAMDDEGGEQYGGRIQYGGTGVVQPIVEDASTNDITFESVTGTNPTTIADGDRIYGVFEIPVVGWSSSTVMSDSADTRVVSFIAENASAQSIPNSTQTKATWDTISKDTHGGWDSANNRYVVAVPGVYRVAAQADFANNGTGTRIVHLYKNGVAQKNTAVPGNSTSNSRPNLSVELDLVAGDYIEVFAQQTSGGSLDINNGVANSYFTVSKISGPAQIAASETVHAEYDTALNALANATNVVIVWDNKIRDSHGMMNASTGVFKIPRAGVYTVSAHASVVSNTDWGDGDRVVVNLNKNSVQYRRLGENTKTDTLTSSNTMSAGGSVSTYLEAGDEISIDVFQSTGAAQTLSSNVTHNYVSILSQGVT